MRTPVEAVWDKGGEIRCPSCKATIADGQEHREDVGLAEDDSITVHVGSTVTLRPGYVHAGRRYTGGPYSADPWYRPQGERARAKATTYGPDRPAEGLRVRLPAVVTCGCGTAVYVRRADYAEIARLTDAGKQWVVRESIEESARDAMADSDRETEFGR